MQGNDNLRLGRIVVVDESIQVTDGKSGASKSFSGVSDICVEAWGRRLDGVGVSVEHDVDAIDRFLQDEYGSVDVKFDYIKALFWSYFLLVCDTFGEWRVLKSEFKSNSSSQKQLLR